MASTKKAATATKRTEKTRPTYHVARMDRDGNLGRYDGEQSTFKTALAALKYAETWISQSNWRYGDRLYVMTVQDGCLVNIKPVWPLAYPTTKGAAR